MSLLAYIQLVYTFAADTLLFGHRFASLELAGAFVITFFNVATIVFKLCFEKDAQ